VSKESVLYSNNVSSGSRKNNRKNPNPVKVSLEEIQESIGNIKISDDEIERKSIKNKNLNMQNNNFISKNKYITKKIMNISKDLKIKNENENENSKFSYSNLKNFNYSLLNYSKFICSCNLSNFMIL
jgi:hypothetical protein